MLIDIFDMRYFPFNESFSTLLDFEMAFDYVITLDFANLRPLFLLFDIGIYSLVIC